MRGLAVRLVLSAAPRLARTDSLHFDRASKQASINRSIFGTIIAPCRSSPLPPYPDHCASS
ncbi:hypothetical protein C3Z06_00445 [Cupriavidus metallidurans]|nr:hypothetical protein C3Z06_00445 [Cupriavidus metallidurans]